MDYYLKLCEEIATKVHRSMFLPSWDWKPVDVLGVKITGADTLESARLKLVQGLRRVEFDKIEAYKRTLTF